MRRDLIAATAVLLIAGTACAEDGPDIATGPSPTSPTSTDTSDRSGLAPRRTASTQPRQDCDALLAHYQDEALKDVGPYGLGEIYPVMAREGMVADGDDAAGAAEGSGRASSGPTAPASPNVSSTNVQVEGVDESDTVKSDGEFIYSLADQRLRIIEPTADGVAERGIVRFDDGSSPTGVFLDGDTIVAIGTRYEAPTGREASDSYGYGGSQLTELIEIDVSDPDQPEQVRSLVIDGWPVASRLSNGVVRLVIESAPVGIEWAQPDGSGLRAEIEATQKNRELIRNSTIENWLPYAVVNDDGELTQRHVIECDDVFIPSRPSGYNTLSVLQVPVDDPLGDWSSGGVAASGATVYATADDLYVATVDWQTWDDTDGDGGTTSIHRFETPAGSAPRYVASGEIEGRLLNQFSMDAYEGALRVATTSDTPFGDVGVPVSAPTDDDRPTSESQVVVLKQDGDRLVETGRVGGLGKSEQIYAVRFMGETGYVVTFRQTDPLYVVDLSDPDNPSLSGELKIPGFSNYLHPAGNDRLLGIGQDADDSGRTRGLQLSLFDVSDPLHPQRIDTFEAPEPDGDGDSYSAAQDDHHAVTIHDDQVFVPFEGYWWNTDDDGESGDHSMTGFLTAPIDEPNLDNGRAITTGERSWSESGENVKSPYISATRSVAIDDRLYGIGYEGVVVIDLTDDSIVAHQRWGR